MDEKVVEAVALAASTNANFEVLAMVADGQVEVSEKGNEAASTPIINRPSRVRKFVEPFGACNEEVKTPKKFTVEQGRGTPLKDIPNVAQKVRKRNKMDEFLRLVHTLLYGKRGKAFQIKSNILQFSGFVWAENEEKQKEKLKEKLHKHNKDMLFQLCDLMDIHVSKSNTKKEELVAKLIDFLECPHGTTDLLVDETPKRKRKGSGTPSKIANDGLPRKRRKNSVVTQKEKGLPENENREEDAKRENDSPVVENYVQEVDMEEEKGVENYVQEVDLEEEEGVENYMQEVDLEEEKGVENYVQEVDLEEEKGVENYVREVDLEEEEDEKGVENYAQEVDLEEEKGVENYMQEVDPEEEKGVENSVQEVDLVEEKGKKDNVASVEKFNSEEKEVAKNDNVKTNNSLNRPSREELCVAACEMIAVSDLDTTIYRDLVKQLEIRLGTDLSERKLELREIIEDELVRIAEIEEMETENDDKGMETEKDDKEIEE